MLVEDPDAFLNLSWVNFMEAPAVQQVGQVITELHHLTAEVWMLIDADSMPAGMLEFWTIKIWDVNKLIYYLPTTGAGMQVFKSLDRARIAVSPFSSILW